PGSLTVSRLRHDLRTYVNHLQGYGEMVLEVVQDDGPAELQAPVRDLLAIGKQLLDIIARHLPNSLADLAPGTVDALVQELREPASRAEGRLVEAIALAGTSDVAGDLKKIQHAISSLHGFMSSSLVAPAHESAAIESDAPAGTKAEAGATILVV